jgi:thimet oligopeptidase
MIFDYTAIGPESIRATTEEAISASTRMLDTIVAGDRSWDATMGPLEDIASLLLEAFGQAGFMGYVHPDSDVRQAGKEAEERLSKFGIEMVFRRDLYEAVAEFAAGEDPTGVEARLLEFTMRDFRNAGHELDPEARDRLRSLSDRLVEIGIAFERNIAEHDDGLVVSTADLEGMPEAYVESLEDGPEPGTHRITLSYPDVIPFLDNSPRRDLREALSFKFNTRAVDANRPLLEEAVAIRQEIAGLFGVPSWAHKVLEERMAETPEAVAVLRRSPATPDGCRGGGARPHAAAARIGHRGFGDHAVRRALLRHLDPRTEYGVDQNVVAEYFPLDSVLEGLFRITGDVFGLTYEELDVVVWHPDVRTFAIHDADDGRLISHFSMDLFPRPGKYSHAAAFPLDPGRLSGDGSYQSRMPPSWPTSPSRLATRPSLLQHSEVETFFHEFGHILHQTLTTSPYVRFAGTNVERDFVEAPSQIMEHWIWRSDVLSTFARHHSTGEPIPAELVDQLVAARNLNVALDKLRQMTFGMLDQELHGPGDKDLDTCCDAPGR